MSAPTDFRDVAETRNGVTTVIAFSSSAGPVHVATLKLARLLMRGERYFV